MQGYETLQTYGSESALGVLVALSLVRELGPVVAALLFASRAGSAMTAEIGLMKATEQLSAMEMMAVDPIARVVAPRFWAGVISMPLLAAMFSAMGVFGGYLVGVVLIGVDEGSFWSQMQSAVDFREDIVNGVIKSFVFGVAVTWIALFEGYDAPPTAEGVSGATTRTVVTSSLAILGLDFILTCIHVSGGCDGTLDARFVGGHCSWCAGIGALVILALKVGNMSELQQRPTLIRSMRRFDNIGGLKPRAPVKSAGVVVGRVTTITFDNEKFMAQSDHERSTSTTSFQGHLGVDPDFRAARRAIHRAGGAAATTQMLNAGRHHQAHAVGGGAGEADQPVPVQQGGRRRQPRNNRGINNVSRHGEES